MPGPNRYSSTLMDPLYGTPWAPDPRHGPQSLGFEAPLHETVEQVPVPALQGPIGRPKRFQRTDLWDLITDPHSWQGPGSEVRLKPEAWREKHLASKPEATEEFTGRAKEQGLKYTWEKGIGELPKGSELTDKSWLAIGPDGTKWSQGGDLRWYPVMGTGTYKDWEEDPDLGIRRMRPEGEGLVRIQESLNKMRQITEDLKSGRTGAKPRADLAHIGRSVAAYNAQQRRKRRRGGGGGVAEGAGVEPTFAERVKRTMTPEQMHTDDFSDLSDIDWPESPEPTSGIGTAGALGALSIPLLALLGAVALSSKKKEKRRFRRTRRGKRIYRDDG
jgi:hypothetical protein